LSYAVTQRRREIAVRMALGAQRGQIGRQFFSLALRLLAVGTVLGFVGTWFAGRAIQAVLFHVPARSATILTGSTAIVALVALTACLLPAYRAARILPMQALAEQ
jgi:ABC-type antimicrobial peptide transport system permease subunit